MVNASTTFDYALTETSEIQPEYEYYAIRIFDQGLLAVAAGTELNSMNLISARLVDDCTLTLKPPKPVNFEPTWKYAQSYNSEGKFEVKKFCFVPIKTTEAKGYTLAKFWVVGGLRGQPKVWLSRSLLAHLEKHNGLDRLLGGADPGYKEPELDIKSAEPSDKDGGPSTTTNHGAANSAHDFGVTNSTHSRGASSTTPNNGASKGIPDKTSVRSTGISHSRQASTDRERGH